MITVTIKKTTRVGIFKNMGGNIPGGNFLGWNIPGGNLPGGSLMGGNFLGGNFRDGSFPDTESDKYHFFFKYLYFYLATIDTIRSKLQFLKI